MNRFGLPTLLFAALLASLCALAPSLAATMSEVSVYFQPATGPTGRQPRTGSGGQLVTIPNSSFPLGGPLSGSSTSAPTNPKPSTTVDGSNYSLAFISITGGAAGGITVFPGADTYSVPVPLQDPPQDILVQNVYFLSGPTWPCPAGTVCPSIADIDEFSETLGTLVDDNFVTVFAPSTSTSASGALTTTANVSGYVETTNQSVKFSAFTPAKQYQSTPTGGNFDRWTTGLNATLGGTDNMDLTVAQNVSNYAIALYRANCPSGYSPSPAGAPVSQCIPITCPAGQGILEDGNGFQCVPIPGCPAACGAQGCIIANSRLPQSGKPADAKPNLICKSSLTGRSIQRPTSLP